jgi:SRSO17 transposase
MSEGPSFDAAMERRFQEYVEDLGAVVGNDARRRGLSDYMTGLLLPGERKSMEPIAERLESGNVSRRHQAIQHFVSEASWKDGPVRERVLGRVVPVMQKRGAIEHWIVDDTTLLKSGQHSVGVAIQYSGLVGTTANCQSLVSLSLATEAASMPVACDLYLPEEWACDRKRRLHAGVPPHLTFRTKIEMALDQIRHAVAAGLPRGIVLADAAYGGARSFRDALRDLALSYALGIESNTTVVPVIAPGHAAASDRSVKVQAGAVRVDVLAGEWEPQDWRTVSWREGSAGQLSGRFAARRVQVAPTRHRDHLDAEEWLIVQDAEAPGAFGSVHCRPTRQSRTSSDMPRAGTGSSRIIANSSRKSAWRSSRVAAGAASTIMSPCAWRLTASSCPSEAFSPLSSPPKPTRTARHNPYSIASLRHRIARMIMHKLDRCPYCAQSYIAFQRPNDNTLRKML